MSDMIRLEVGFFTTAFFVGILLLAGYDIIRIVRRIFIHNSFIMAVEDMIFWAASGVFVFRMIYEKNDGIVRGIALFSLFLGMVCYHNTVSDFLVKWITRIIGTPIKKVLNVIKKTLKNLKKAVRILYKRAQQVKEPEQGGQDGQK